jgi:hypothetical protein
MPFEWLAVYTQQLHHAPADWLAMGGLVALMALPVLVARIRHERWRRRVLRSMR